MGITVFFEKENIDTANMTDEIMITILGGLAQEESVSISQNTQWAIQKRMKNGTYIVSNQPYGYRKENGSFIVHEEEAMIVRRIYAEFLQGHGFESICRHLNDEGIIMSKSGGRWKKKAVRYILSNEKYIGDCLWRKQYEFYDCGDDVAKILKANVESVFAGMEQSEIQKIEQRLKEIDKARNDMISLITSGSCDEDTLDSEFAKLYEEETQLSGKLLSLKAQCKASDDTKEKIKSTIAEIENSRFQLEAFDDVLIRKLIECVKVISKTEIIIIFKGGYEVKVEVEKK